MVKRLPLRSAPRRPSRGFSRTKKVNLSTLDLFLLELEYSLQSANLQTYLRSVVVNTDCRRCSAPRRCRLRSRHVPSRARRRRGTDRWHSGRGRDLWPGGRRPRPGMRRSARRCRQGRTRARCRTRRRADTDPANSAECPADNLGQMSRSAGGCEGQIRDGRGKS